MVLRSFLASTVCSLPIVGAMAPDILIRYATPADDTPKDIRGSDLSSSPVEETSVNSDSESAKIKYDEKPTQKILNSILSKRRTAHIEHLNSDTDDCMINLQPIHKLADLDDGAHVDNYGKYEVLSEAHASTSDLVCSSQDSVYDGPTLLHLDKIGNERGAKRSTKQNVEKYLTDQNCKFDELISRNLNNVLETSGKKESALVKSANNVADMSSRLMHFIWWSKPMPGSQNQSGSELSPPADENNSKKIKSLSYVNDTDMNLFRYLLQDMNPERKRQFYEALCEDLEIYEDAKDMFSRPSTSSPSSDSIELIHARNVESQGKNDTLENLQSLALLSVRFSFLAMRLAIPVTLWLVRKFSSNDLYIFNKNNFNRLLVLMVKFLDTIEQKINSEGQAKDYYLAGNFIGDAHAIFRKDRQHSASESQEEGTIESVFQDFSNGATEFIASKLDSHANNSWKGKAFSFIAEHAFDITATTKDNNNDYKSKPEYAQYFSKKEYQMGDSKDSEERRNSDNDTTILHAAEVFARQLE